MANKIIVLNNVDELSHALAGAGAGAISMTLTYPLVTITTKLQTQNKDADGKLKSKVKTIKDIYLKDGLLGYYSGLESAVYGMATTNFVYYYFYELSARALCKLSSHTISRQLNATESMVSGAIAGSMTAIASNPIWIANTRMTISKSKKSTLRVIWEIIEKDGFLTLFNGLKPALILVSNPIIQYTVYEQLRNIVLKVQKRKILSPSWAFILGAIGKLTATSLTYPYITLKTRMHLLNKENESGNSSMFSLMKDIIKKDGITGLYHGIGIKLVQSILTAAFLFFFKEGLILWSMKTLRLLRQFNGRKISAKM